VLDVTHKELPAAMGVTAPSFGDSGFGVLLRFVGDLEAGERPGRASVPADVMVVGGVVQLTERRVSNVAAPSAPPKPWSRAIPRTAV
jgi:hypothetical protein